IGCPAALGYSPLWEFQVLLTAWMVILPLGFPTGMGGGEPPSPSPPARAPPWTAYFRGNTDHKVIGVEDLVTTIFSFVAAGLMAMFMRAELARPGMQFVDNNKIGRASCR